MSATDVTELPLIEEPTRPAPRAGGRRRWAALVAVAGVAGAALGAVVLAGGGDAPTAADVLGDVQAFVAEAEGVRATTRTEAHLRSGSGSGGSTTSMWMEAESWSSFVADEHHVVLHTDGWVDELLVVDGSRFSRGAEDDAALADASWAEEPLEEGWLDEAGVDTVLVGDLVAAAHDAVLADGREVLTAAVDPAALGEAADGVDSVELRLELDGDRPTRVVIRVAGADGDATTTLDVAEWTAPEGLAAPDVDAVDATPSYDEEAIAASGIALHQPSALPEGWALAAAGVLPAAEAPEGCDQVVLDYWGPGDNDSLTLYQLPAACEGIDPDAGYPTTTIGATVVQAEGNLPDADLDELLAGLEPFDPATMVELPFE